MSKCLNKVIMIGNLGSDVTIRHTPNGKKVANVSLALNSRYGDNERTDWARLEMWEGLADVAETYTSKGSKVYIEGEFRNEQWTDRETGETRYGSKIVVRELILLDGRRQMEQVEDLWETATLPETAAEEYIDDDDIPFDEPAAVAAPVRAKAPAPARTVAPARNNTGSRPVAPIRPER